MNLPPGTRLGPYEIVAPLGAGGMGEVYRARDSRLGREVAVKVLPQHLSANPEIRARFEREARTVSSLNHPNICVLHDVGRDAGTDYLVMELVEGETLAQRLEKGALPVGEVLRLGAQIADALDRAHRAGVVHRDLKPGNVMVTRAGAKLMDFGLARTTGIGASASGSGAPPTSLTQSPTMAHQPLTAAGTWIGTFQYMSPEQLEGKEADSRSDVWALGCVLYEMSTGRRAFDGRSHASLISAIMSQEPPPLLEAAPSAPPAFENLVRACLAKDPADRLQSAHDLRLHLSWIVAGGSLAGTPAPLAIPAKRRPWPLLAGVAAGGVALGLLAGSLAMRSQGGASAGSGGSAATRVTAITPLTDAGGRQYDPSLSPDGKSLVYVAQDGGDEDIFLQRVGGENPVNLTESYAGGDFNPAFSPDGERIAFGSMREGGGLFVMGATGESPRRLSPEGSDPSWSPDGRRIVFSTERIITPYARQTSSRLWIVDAESGEKKQLLDEDAVGPSWSPSGARIAFWSNVQGQRDIRTIAVDGGASTPVTSDTATDWDPFWAPDGRSLYFISDRGGSPDLWRIAVDQATGRPQGEPEPVTTGVARVMAGSISSDGKRIAISIDDFRGEILSLGFDPVSGRPQGETRTALSASSSLTQLSLSPDGRWIAYRTTAPREDLVVARLDGSERRRLTSDTHRNRGPRWIRGSDWISFYSNRGGSYGLYVMRSNGTELREVAGRPDIEFNQPAVSPDGSRLALGGYPAGEQARLAILDVRESWFQPGFKAEPLDLRFVEGNLTGPYAWSPDGRRLAGFTRSPQGFVPAIYSLDSGEIAPHSASGMSNSFGMTWLPDGRRLLYWDYFRGAAVLADMDRGGLTEVPGIPGPSELQLSADGRTLALNRTIYEGDIWLLTLK